MIFELLDDVGGLGGKTSVTSRVNQVPVTCRTLVTHLIDQRDYHPDALSFHWPIQAFFSTEKMLKKWLKLVNILTVFLRSESSASILSFVFDSGEYKNVYKICIFIDTILVIIFCVVYNYGEIGIIPSVDRKSTRLNSSHSGESRMPSSA